MAGEILDQDGNPILDENGNPLLDETAESGPTPVDPGGGGGGSDAPPVPPSFIFPEWRPIDVGGQFAVGVGASVLAVPQMELNDFDSVKLRFHLYDGDNISFGSTGRSTVAPYLSGYASDVWLFRQSQVWQRYRVLPVDQEWGGDGGDAINVTAIDYKQVLNSRGIHSLTAPASLVFSSDTEQGVIIQRLIEHTQAQPNGDLGITYGTVNTGVVRQRNEYAVGDNIGKLISDLSKVIGGPVWRVAPGLSGQRELSVRLPNTFATYAQPAVLGTNLDKLRRVPPSQFANSGFAPAPSGATAGSTLQGVWFDAVTLPTDPRGRWELVRAPSSGTTTQANVDETARGIVDEFGDPPAAWVMTVKTARWLTDSPFMPGGFVRVKVPPTTVDPLTGIENSTLVTVQVIEVTLDVDAAGATTVTVAAAEVP